MIRLALALALGFVISANVFGQTMQDEYDKAVAGMEAGMAELDVWVKSNPQLHSVAAPGRDPKSRWKKPGDKIRDGEDWYYAFTYHWRTLVLNHAANGVARMKGIAEANGKIEDSYPLVLRLAGVVKEHRATMAKRLLRKGGGK